jgi:hypothetical protein
MPQKLGYTNAKTKMFQKTVGIITESENEGFNNNSI